MRSVEVLVSCDACFKDNGVKVAAEQTLIFGSTYGGSVDRIIELCATHASSMTIADLAGSDETISNPYRAPIADKPARKIGAPRREDLTLIPCPFCGGEYAEGTGIAIHVRSVHPERFQPKTDWRSVTFDGKRVRTG
jgi:hypothetical protein